MTIAKPLLPALALIGFAALATAQEQTADTTVPATDSRPEVVLDTGEPENAGAAPDDGTYLKETSGDWEVQCLKVEDGDDPCQIHQTLRQDGNAVAEVSLFRLAGDGPVVAGATILAPLETLLTEKLRIQVDTGQAKRYDFSFCNQAGCYARIGLTAEDVASFKAGVTAKVTIVPVVAPDQKVTLDMSLKGFTAGYDQVTTIKQ
ncbi:invasion associated locus B family protein [Pseudoprimorskyibacter insulae]|uniref:Invasion associated locus B (IalB) protein n=1 Tax=Pseudoprimorskyibacter insulae TaxID=1695997 RepID=A0A2R8AWD8_9RHOB|nr:invasion associated locus B family protein [Pseudoprimorskyibacter insulae]SPF80361.1 hypothetical protein PRI8871_02166 [Pseudoprimorskyibacter insulae]